MCLSVKYESSFSCSFLLFQKGIIPTYVVTSYAMYINTLARVCHPADAPTMLDNNCDGHNHGDNKVGTDGILGLSCRRAHAHRAKIAFTPIFQKSK